MWCCHESESQWQSAGCHLCLRQVMPVGGTLTQTEVGVGNWRSGGIGSLENNCAIVPIVLHLSCCHDC